MTSLQNTKRTLTGDLIAGNNAETGRKTSGRFRGSMVTGAIILLLIPVILVWAVVTAGLFGYKVVDTRGDSMEPALKSGDALWGKPADIATVRAGDIITLAAGENSITHRVIDSVELSNGEFLVTTQGDANGFSESWYILPDTNITVIQGRVPFGGYLLGVIISTPCKIVFGFLAIVAGAFLLYKRRSPAIRKTTPDSL